MTEADEQRQIGDLVNRFSTAEQSLRSLLEAAQRLASAREELSGVREEMGQARADSLARLEEARRTIR